MKKITIKNFSGLTYLTVKNVPVEKSEFGDVIALKAGELEKVVSRALIENRVPIRGVEFRLMKSAIKMSNEAISNEIGISRNTVLKWGQNPSEPIPMPYEILFRILVAEQLNVKMDLKLDSLKSVLKAKRVYVEAA